MRGTACVLTASLLLSACRKEVPATEVRAVPSSSAPIAGSATVSPPVKPAIHSTAERCAGDGSYEQSLECLRIAAHLRFTTADLEGELSRTRAGQEQVVLEVRQGGSRGKWLAEAKPAGVVWTRDGKHVTDPPADLERLYQRVTIFPDPQKKEGSPLRSATSDGLVRYDFTDANNGERYAVTVSRTDGHMTEVQIIPAGGKPVVLRFG